MALSAASLSDGLDTTDQEAPLQDSTSGWSPVVPTAVQLASLVHETESSRSTAPGSGLDSTDQEPPSQASTSVARAPPSEDHPTATHVVTETVGGRGLATAAITDRGGALVHDTDASWSFEPTFGTATSAQVLPFHEAARGTVANGYDE
jgi:hypothetical protein